MKKSFGLLVLLNLLTFTLGNFVATCPQECRCVWASGYKQANCSNSQLQAIPTHFSADIQIVDLTGNHIEEITSHTFEDNSLINLKKLCLRDCKIRNIQQNAFHGLAILIQLDLSMNDLKVLPADTFKDTLKIRWILLNDNKLEKLEDGLFKNLPFLQKVDLSRNRIVTLGSDTFMNVPRLSILRLNDNQFEFIDIGRLRTMSSLQNVDLHNNPWRCDCNLHDVIQWVTSNNFYTTPISCAEPSFARDVLWKEIDFGKFSC